MTSATGSPTAHTAPETAHPIKKFLLGGIGGLVPLIMTLVLVDIQVIATYIQSLESDMYYLSGYLLRFLALFLLGGFWAYLHSSEKDPIKLFQLGIVAPAMITGMINAHNLDNLRDTNPSPGSAAVSFSFIASAYAEDEEPKPEKPPKPKGPVGKVIKGFLAN